MFLSQGQRSVRMSKRLAEKAEEEGSKEEEEEGEEEDMKEDDGRNKEAASALACDPSLTEVQTTSIPSSKFNTACMYHSLLIHIQITQFSSVTMHRLSLLTSEISLPFWIIRVCNTIVHKHSHTQTHLLSVWEDW